MKHFIVSVLVFVLALSFTACGDQAAAPSSTGSGSASPVSSGTAATPDWSGAFVGVEYNTTYYINITEPTSSNFIFFLSTVDGDTIFAGKAVFTKDNNYEAVYDGETVLTFLLNANSDALELTAEDDRLKGKYKIINPDDRYDLGGRGDAVSNGDGRGDLIPDSQTPEWEGVFDGEEYTIRITNFNGDNFYFEVYLTANGSIFCEGAATLYPDNSLMAEYGQISLSLYENYNEIDFFAPESHENARMRGHYERRG